VSEPFHDVVGVRFSPRGPVAWYGAGDLPAAVGSWVIAEHDGVEAVGQVIVGRGQCLSFPGSPVELRQLLRPAREDEIPQPPPTAGQALLDSLP
jgi:hypothetical protein